VARLPYSLSKDGAQLSVRVVPKSAASRILGLVEDARGAALKVAVHAPPAGGKANEAVLRLLADALALPRSAFSLALGAADRRKLVRIGGDPATVATHLAQGLRPWLHI
jgi:uncharacterized protein (TIGR00251 family)